MAAPFIFLMAGLFLFPDPHCGTEIGISIRISWLKNCPGISVSHVLFHLLHCFIPDASFLKTLTNGKNCVEFTFE